MVAQESSAHKNHNQKKTHCLIAVAFETVSTWNNFVTVTYNPPDWTKAVKLFNKTYTIPGKHKISSQMSAFLNTIYTSHLDMGTKHNQTFLPFRTKLPQPFDSSLCCQPCYNFSYIKKHNLNALLKNMDILISSGFTEIFQSSNTCKLHQVVADIKKCH